MTGQAVWHVISSEDLMSILKRVQAGADPDLLYLEEYANDEHEYVPEDRTWPELRRRAYLVSEQMPWRKVWNPNGWWVYFGPLMPRWKGSAIDDQRGMLVPEDVADLLVAVSDFVGSRNGGSTHG